MKLPPKWQTLFARISPKQKQYILATGVLAGGVGVFWAFLALSFQPTPQPAAQVARNRVVTNPELAGGVTPMQVSPVDQWVGNAGKELAQYKVEREGQEKFNADLKAKEASILQRLADLEKKENAQAATAPLATPTEAAAPAVQSASTPAVPIAPTSYPPSVPAITGQPSYVAGMPAVVRPDDEAPAMVRIFLGEPGRRASSQAERAVPGPGNDPGANKGELLDNFLPVSFVRGQLLGGIDAPTGGQAQSNPLPVLIRLLDNAVLPNRFRAEVRECFVIASGYGDISSERAYMRTSNLSCVRRDQSVMELKIEGNVYGEDGKLGMRGRLVTKQGQLLANALRAGIVGGIGQGFSQGGSTFTSSPLGTLVTSPEGTGEQIRRGMAGGVGRALDNLANYYIKLAEQTFPVIEIDASREVDIVLTRGVRMPVPSPAADGGVRSGEQARIEGESDEPRD